MDVLPDRLSLLDASGVRTTGSGEIKRVPTGVWSEATWDNIIVANVSLLGSCLKQAGIIADDSELIVLGIQIDNIDVVLAEVRESQERELRRLVIVEDKLLGNSEAKRQVLGQLLDYARVVQEQWPLTRPWGRFAAAETAWIKSNQYELLDNCRRGDFVLVVAGDGIDPMLERLAKRFAGQDHPLNLSELALVSMSLYRLGDQYLLVPHVVSAVQRSERELTIKVVVQDVAGQPIPAELIPERPTLLEVPRGAALPVREDVGSFLRGLIPRVEQFLPDLKPPANPRKSMDFVESTPNGTTVYYRVHFGGYSRELWSPIEVGAQITTADTATRDWWVQRLRESPELPQGTVVTTGGPKTVNVFRAFPWANQSDLTEEPEAAIVRQFQSVAAVVRPIVTSGTPGTVSE